jgi:hypothetical protein
MTPEQMADHIEGAQMLRDDYARRVKEIDRDIIEMKAQLAKMIQQKPIIVGS